MTLNRKLLRSYREYAGIPLSEGINKLEERGVIRAIDDTASLFVLTDAGLDCR